MIPKWVITLNVVIFFVFVQSTVASPLPASAEEDKPYVNQTATTLKVIVKEEKEVTTPLAETTAFVDVTNGTTIQEEEEAAEFERPDAVEGGKAEESQKNAETVPNEPPVQEGEGEAREDIEPDEGDSIKKMVEDAKGNSNNENNVNLQPNSQFRVEEAPDSNFLTFLMVATLLVVCIYIIQHNKKKILGFVFEGKTGRNVRYRRLSQHDDREDIIY
ncbi:unnamed protein product [Auanema sp. JU1783]|nr:unnamed protein product [Auanema sp. JU1783]